MSEASAGDFYPPGLAPNGVVQPVAAGGLIVSRQSLTPDALRGVARGLAGRCSLARAVPARRIVQELGALHARWAAAESPLRREAVGRLHSVTGYAEASIDEGLQSLFSQMDVRRLEEWLVRGGLPLVALDADGAGPGLLAFGPRLTAVVSSGNVPGAALPSVVQALLLKSPCLVKTASAEPALLPLYARSLSEQSPELTQALAVTGWEGGETALEAALLPELEALIAYGGDEAIRSLRSRLPIRARFIGYGHRLSFTAIGRELLADEDVARDTADQVARDLCVYDQQGCYSPQTVFVELGGALDAERFGALLAEALETLSARLPRRGLSAAESAAIHQYRGSVEMRRFSDAGLRLWASEGGTRWTVALETSAALAPCVLNRTAVLRPTERLEALRELIAGHREHLLAAALGVSEERFRLLAAGLGDAGVVRVTRPGRAQTPLDSLRHDGVNAVAALTRFVAMEMDEG